MGGWFLNPALKTPCFVVDEGLLRQNLEILKEVSERSKAKILLAQKAFSMFSVYPLIGRYLAGTAASGLYEARLGREEFGGETHVFSPAYCERDFRELLTYADHLIFNTPGQLNRFGGMAKQAKIEVGLRLNPECSTQEGHGIYDPCAPGSRLGTVRGEFREELLPLLDGFHFHTLCEQNSDALERTVEALEEKFGSFLPQMKWLNLGGGHHITRADYDRERLIRLIGRLRKTYGVEIYLEPGEAVVLNAGYLVTTVLDTLKNGMDIAILDASAACHTPDVIEMPYRPPLKDSGKPGEKACTCRLGGPTCLAGDVFGDYSFDRQPAAGDRLVFEDMALYTMVKTNTFNGMALPSMALLKEDGQLSVIREFSYGDFKGRLS